MKGKNSHKVKKFRLGKKRENRKRDKIKAKERKKNETR